MELSKALKSSIDGIPGDEDWRESTQEEFRRAAGLMLGEGMDENTVMYVLRSLYNAMCIEYGD